MQATRLIMGMPITLTVIDSWVTPNDLETIFNYFRYVDAKYSPFKVNQLSMLNNGQITLAQTDSEFQKIFSLCDDTKKATEGYFDIYYQGKYNPSGLVKGWAIKNAADLLSQRGFQNFCVDAGGDLELRGHNQDHLPWQVGVRNPFNRFENVKVLSLTNCGVATSGTSIRGQHIYSPKNSDLKEIVSLTVVGPNIYEADRFATAAFAMGRSGINFINSLKGFGGFMIDRYGQATYTTNLAN